jgi:hypothetical protein
MDLTEIIQEICENHPDKMVVDISDYENADHQLYKKLYEDICVAKRKLEEENASLMFDKMNAEKENAELLMENKELKRKNAIISESIIPTVDSIKHFCEKDIFVSNIIADPDAEKEEVFNIDGFKKTISSRPGIYGVIRPSWFTPLQHELSKKNIQKKNISSSSKTLMDRIRFWKKAGKRVVSAPEEVSKEYDEKRKKDILELIESDCSNEEKYLKYFLMTPGMDKEYFKTLQGASELNINAKLIISLLEQPNDKFNKVVVENYISEIHKGTEFNLKQELAEELVKGDWYIVADINGVTEKYQVVPISILENIVEKINAVCDFLDKSADDVLSAELAESTSSDNQDVNLSNTDNPESLSANLAESENVVTDVEVPIFVEFDDSMI